MASLTGHEFEQALGDGEGQESLACCSPWGRKEPDTTQQLNNNPPMAPKSGLSYVKSHSWVWLFLRFPLCNDSGSDLIRKEQAAEGILQAETTY